MLRLVFVTAGEGDFLPPRITEGSKKKLHSVGRQLARKFEREGVRPDFFFSSPETFPVLSTVKLMEEFAIVNGEPMIEKVPELSLESGHAFILHKAGEINPAVKTVVCVSNIPNVEHTAETLKHFERTGYGHALVFEFSVDDWTTVGKPGNMPSGFEHIRP